MSMNRLLRQTVAVVTAIVPVFAAYLLVARPYQLRWGATNAEVARAMPGDALSSRPTFLSTRAITIDATPEVIWPWLVQIGYGRAGFYGYDIIENIGSPKGIRSADRILPELQQIAVGDPLPLSAAGGLIVNAIEPNQFLVWSGTTGTYPGAFTWALYPDDASRTRLVSRIQWSHRWTSPLSMFMDLFTEFTDHIAVRKILHGVKDRAEGRAEPFARQAAEFGVFVLALLEFLLAAWLLLRRPPGWSGWLRAFLAGVAWLVVWYAPIPIEVGAVVTLVVLWLLLPQRLSHAALRVPPVAAAERRT